MVRIRRVAADSRPARLMKTLFAALLLLVAGPSCAAPDADGGNDEAPLAVVTGANRGLGLEMARQLASAGYGVVGTARKPAEAEELRALGVEVRQLDVTDDASVAALAEALGGRAVDLLVNNAGIYPRESGLASLDLDDVKLAFDVNALGPLRVTRALLPNLREGHGKKIVHVSSSMGSIASNGRGGSYAYRASKTALNSFNKTLSIELAGEGFVAIVVNPGWVRTDMGGPNARLTPEQSVAGLLKVIAGLEPGDNGRFFDHSGEELPW